MCTVYHVFGFALCIVEHIAFFFLEDEAADFELEKRKRRSQV